MPASKLGNLRSNLGSLESATSGLNGGNGAKGSSNGAANGNAANLLSLFQVKVGGTDLSASMSDLLLDISVESSIHLPDMCAIRLYDADFSLVEGNHWDIGITLQILAGFAGKPLTKIFDGEITALEMDMAAQGVPTLLVRGFDKAHRLHRGRKRETFVQMTDADIVKRVGQSAGFTVQADSTTPTHDWVMQNNQTDWEFLSERAARNGFRLYVENQNTLCFKKVVNPTTASATIAWGETLLSFRPRAVASPQVSEVIVRGWDPKTKTALVGTATAANGTPVIGLGKTGKQVAASFGDAKMVVVDRVVHSQGEAQQIARSIYDDIAGGFIEAEGHLVGNPQVLAGETLEVKNVGTRFSGKYFVTAATHIWSHDEGYSTSFAVSGKRADTLLASMEDGLGARAPLGGNIVIGIVTNNVDPDNWGRVKVKFPWLDEQKESFWARLASPMAGAGRGFHFLPEVNDEVLVAFEHGDIRRPYILGALWNGKDAAVEKNNVAVVGGKVVHRTIKTRIGHTILLDDTDNTGEMKMTTKYGHVFTLNDTNKHITLKTKDGHKIVLDDPSDKITVQTVKGHKIVLNDPADSILISDRTGSNKMTIKSTDNSIKIECLGNFTVDAKGKVLIQGAAGLEAKTPAKALLQGLAGTDVKTPAMLNLEGTAMANLKSSGILIVQGSLVKIN